MAENLNNVNGLKYELHVLLMSNECKNILAILLQLFETKILHQKILIESFVWKREWKWWINCEVEECSLIIESYQQQQFIVVTII